MNTIKKNLLAFLIFTSTINILHGQTQYSIKYGDNKEEETLKKLMA